MSKIKLRETVKDIKVLDKSQVAAEKMKDAFVRTKDKAEHGYYSDGNSPSEYASDNVSNGVENITREAGHQFNKQGQKSVENTKQNIDKAKQKFKDFKERKSADTAKNATDLPKEKAKEQAKKKTQDTFRHSARQTTDKTIKTTKQAEKTIKQSARSTAKTVKSTGKGTVKTAQKSVKTAEHTAKATIKTTQQAVKTAQKIAQTTAKAAKLAAQASRAAAKVASTTAKAAVKATIAAVKAIIAATKALISAIIAGGWVAVVIILVICMIGLLVGSVFGIFFSGESNNGSPTMQTVVAEINTDYQNKINEIKLQNTYDVLEMSGSRAVWKEVLAVYSVKTVTDPENPQEVATIDNGKKALLKDIFWEMNVLSSRTESKTETIIETSDDGNGNIVETEKSVTRTYLYITVKHKTASEMADKYNWNNDQRKQLAELLDPKNDSMWAAVLYGISDGNTDIVAVALSQLGNAGGQPYWSWYGFGGRVEWCACFVSWCADQCGYIEAGIIPKFAGCQSQGIPWFKDRGQWQDNSYTPKAGDIIFFDWEDDGASDHVGIVEKVENGTVYTVEGNSGDACKQRQYDIGSIVIIGYGIPMY